MVSFLNGFNIMSPMVYPIYASCPELVARNPTYKWPGSSNGLYMYGEPTVPVASLNVKDWLDSQ